MIETVDEQRGVARSSGEEGETTMTFGILIVSLRFIYKPRPDQTDGRGEGEWLRFCLSDYAIN